MLGLGLLIKDFVYGCRPTRLLVKKILECKIFRSRIMTEGLNYEHTEFVQIYRKVKNDNQEQRCFAQDRRVVI